MSNNLFNKNDPIADAVRGVIDDGAKERAAKEAVLKEFGVVDRKALPHELQPAFDAKVNTMLNESSHKEYGVDDERARAEKGEKFGKKKNNLTASQKKIMVHKLMTKLKPAKVDSKTPPLREEEQLDELSKETLGSYVKKASDSASTANFKGGQLYSAKKMNDIVIAMGGIDQDDIENHEKYKKLIKKYTKTVTNRKAGISKAVDKLAKEETEQLNELSKDKLSQYIKKAGGSMRDLRYKSGTKNIIKFNNRAVGQDLALQKKWGSFDGTTPKVKANEETVNEGLKIRKGIDKTHVVDGKGNVVKTFDYHGHSSKHEERAKDFIKIMKKYAPGKVTVPPEPKETKKKVAEETLNELSKGTLKSYIEKAKVSRKKGFDAANWADVTSVWGGDESRRKMRDEIGEKGTKTALKRGVGIAKAKLKMMAKEEVSFQDRINNASSAGKGTGLTPGVSDRAKQNALTYAAGRKSQMGASQSNLANSGPKGGSSPTSAGATNSTAPRNRGLGQGGKDNGNVMGIKQRQSVTGRKPTPPTAQPNTSASGPDTAKQSIAAKQPDNRTTAQAPAAAQQKAKAPVAAQAKAPVAAQAKAPVRAKPTGSGVSDAVKKSVARDVSAGRYQKDAKPDKIAAMRQKAINTARDKKASFAANRSANNPFKKKA